MTSNHCTHAIFDFDETIVTLQIDWEFWYRGIPALIQQYEPDFDPQTPIDTPSIHHFVSKYGSDFLTDYVEFEQAIEKKYYQGYEIVEKGWQLLQTFHQEGKQLFLLTSNCRPTVLPILEELKITKYFTKIITLNDVPNLKPSPAAWDLIATPAADKSQYVMVGDSASDSGFAENVGIDFINVKN